MNLYDEDDKLIARFSEAIIELEDSNQAMSEDQMYDFIDDWSAAVYENPKDHQNKVSDNRSALLLDIITLQ